MGEFTYEHLFDVLRRERSREELQELDEQFYALAQEYLAMQAARAREQDPLSSQGDQLRTQLQNARKLLRELYDRREKKIMLLALNKARTGSNIIDTSSLLAAEKRLFEDSVAVLKRFRTELSPVQDVPAVPASKPKPRAAAPAPRKDKPVEKKEAQAAPGENITITKAVPKFLGANKETYGPFEPGQTVAVPHNIARILIKKGRAEQA